MLSKAITLTSMAALVGQSLAFNAHRHLHQADKRAYKVVYETVWSTVYVTDCDGVTKTASAVDAPTSQPVAEQTTTSYTTLSATSTVTSTSTVVLPSTSAVAPGPAPPVLQQTTLSISVMPAPSSYPPSSASFSSSAAAAPAPPPSSTPAAESTASQAQQTAQAASSTSPASSSAPAPAPSYAPPSIGAGKRGLAYNDAALANTFGSLCADCTWGYNWGSSAGSLDSKYEYVPMLWGTQPVHTDNWDEMVTKAIDSGSKAITSFNEPDNGGQANLSPAAAAQAHAQYLNKYAGKVQIGSPSVTNSGTSGQGVSWLSAFMDACKAQPGGCAVDFCTVHWYSPAQYADTLFDHLEKAHEACDNKPIWLTEFAPQGSDSEITQFMHDVLPKLEAVPYLARYSYFMVSQGSLMASPQNPSTFGQVYATA